MPLVRAVLDTNVILDCFAFDGPMARPLADAVREGRVKALTSAACLQELERVLAYRKLKLDEARRAGTFALYRGLAECIEPSAVTGVPRCRDRDDQIFLDLAAAARADFLFSRDARVLATGSRMLKTFAVKVMEPRIWASIPPLS
jgi:putative PIN family toxin of toxin-antitoxin system